MTEQDKDSLRRQMRKVREGVSIIEMAELSVRICKGVLDMPEYRSAKTVMCYSGLNGEVATSSLLLAVLRDKKTLCLPRVTGKSQMEAGVCTDPKTQLSAGAYGILEPSGTDVVAPEAIDLILVPGLAFTENGDRLGYGAGYYDHYLKQCENATRCALAYESQIVPSIPTNGFDIPMQFIATDERLIPCGETEKPKEQ